jgi:hypothetical protein
LDHVDAGRRLGGPSQVDEQLTPLPVVLVEGPLQLLDGLKEPLDGDGVEARAAENAHRVLRLLHGLGDVGPCLVNGFQ